MSRSAPQTPPAASRFTRRRLLAAAAAGGAALALPAVSVATPKRRPEIVIVGAGLAGLRCADVLWRRHGLASQVFEWNTHPGGRVSTLRGFFADGAEAEQCGEFVSSEHTAVRSLARNLGLSLQTSDYSPPSTSSTYKFDGAVYSEAALDADWQTWGRRLFRDAVRRAPWPTRFDRQVSETARQWDHMSVPEWLDRHIPGGLDSRFSQLLIQDVIDEFGGDPADQSALNVVYLLGYDDSSSSGFQPRRAPMLSGTDEAYHIRGGNDQLVTGLAGRLPGGTLAFDHRLVALRVADGRCRCTFESAGSTREVVADQVVLALPFATLRHVDLRRAGFSARKLRAIADLGMGSNSKVQLQMTSPVWQRHGSNGTFYTDNGLQSGWPAAGVVPGTPPVIVDFPSAGEGRTLGSRYGLTSDRGPAPHRLATDTLARLERLFPGISGAWNGLAWVHWTPGDPHIGGSYSYYRVGQYTGISGVEPLPQGRVHFAGEHTSLAFQGYMEGALRTGRRAADEVAAAV